jgi:hypothetical protein
MLSFLRHNSSLFRILAAMRFDRLGNLKRMKPDGAAKGIRGKFATL